MKERVNAKASASSVPGATLIFACIRRFGPFLGYKILNSIILGDSEK